MTDATEIAGGDALMMSAALWLGQFEAFIAAENEANAADRTVREEAIPGGDGRIPANLIERLEALSEARGVPALSEKAESLWDSMYMLAEAVLCQRARGPRDVLAKALIAAHKSSDSAAILGLAPVDPENPFTLEVTAQRAALADLCALCGFDGVPPPFNRRVNTLADGD